jgi:hypothetical protein
MRSPDTAETLVTLTHARLRVRQGDYTAAGTLLRRILKREPDHGEALELLRSIDDQPRTVSVEPVEDVLKPPEARDAARLARGFRDALVGREGRRQRIRRLEDWLRRVRRQS